MVNFISLKVLMLRQNGPVNVRYVTSAGKSLDFVHCSNVTRLDIILKILYFLLEFVDGDLVILNDAHNL